MRQAFAASLPVFADLVFEEDEDMTPHAFEHVTVMRREVVEALSPREGVFLDVTLGGGGHAEALLEANPEARVLGFDRDPAALAAASERLARFGRRFTATKATFSEVPQALVSMGIEHPLGLVADLGVSSPQIDDPARGMSFRAAGPLDMRMDPSSGETVLELIERSSSDELADVIYHYGEERRSRRIARCIKQAADARELSTTLDLRRAVVRAVGPARVGGVDPATRTFQALRIAVNRELDQIEQLLAWSRDVMAQEGIVAIISFHSLEDRLVKRALQDRSAWSPLTKKPIIAGDEETALNPRARSAKLRAAKRLDGESDSQREQAEPMSGMRIRSHDDEVDE